MNTLRIPRSAARPLIALAVLLVALIAVSYAASAAAPRTVASASDLATQRASAERSIDKVYKTGLEQLKTTRALRLAISDAQAAAIEQRYAGQLRDLRKSALQAIAELYAMPGDQAASYVQQTEARLDGQPPASAEPVMLAPRLYVIVQRMAELGAQLADAGIREMTQAPTSTPAPTGTARVSPTPSPSR